MFKIENMDRELDDVSVVWENDVPAESCYIIAPDQKLTLLREIFAVQNCDDFQIYSEKYHDTLEYDYFFEFMHELAIKHIYIYAICGNSLLYYNSRDYYALVIYSYFHLEPRYLQQLDSEFLRALEQDVIGMPPENKIHIRNLNKSMVKLGMIEKDRILLRQPL